MGRGKRKVGCGSCWRARSNTRGVGPEKGIGGLLRKPLQACSIRSGNLEKKQGGEWGKVSSGRVVLREEYTNDTLLNGGAEWSLRSANRAGVLK